MRPSPLLPMLLCGGASAVLVACSGAGAAVGAPESADGGTLSSDAADASTVPDPARNSPLCPVNRPDGGTGCPSVGLLCGYPSGCAVPTKATCSASGTWALSIPDCAVQCPSAVPASASTCSVSTLECEYGADPRPWCRDRAACTLTSTASQQSVWIVGKQSSIYANGSCSEPAPACPATLPSTDERCTAANLCTYQASGVSCVCQDRNAGCGACETTNFRWTCAPTPPAPCPATPPNAGSGCERDGTSCTYGKCGTLAATTLTCTAGAWRRSKEPCP